MHEGIPTTAPARTLLDLAAILPTHRLRRAIEEAEVKRLTHRAELRDVRTRAPRHPGSTALKGLLDKTTEPSLTRSGTEDRLLTFIAADGLPRPEVNVLVAGHEVDLLWRAQRLVVEVDGFASHHTRAAFERDRRRDADVGAIGFRVIRVTWRQIVEAPEALLVRLARAIGAQAYIGAVRRERRRAALAVVAAGVGSSGGGSGERTQMPFARWWRARLSRVP